MAVDEPSTGNRSVWTKVFTDSSRSKLLLEFDEIRHLVAAAGAPRRPETDKQDFPSEASRVHPVPTESRHHNLWHRLIDIGDIG